MTLRVGTGVMSVGREPVVAEVIASNVSGGERLSPFQQQDASPGLAHCQEKQIEFTRCRAYRKHGLNRRMEP